MTGRAAPYHTFFAPCPRGLEGVLAAELEELGAHDIAATAGGVGFAGAFSLCYRVNLESRIASRVLWRVFHGRYRTEQDVYQAAYDLPWRDWFSSSRTIKLKVIARSRALIMSRSRSKTPSATSSVRPPALGPAWTPANPISALMPFWTLTT